MKKLTLIVLAIGVISLVACKKDRTCTCTVTQTSGSSAVSYTQTVKYTASKKGDARANCLSYTATEGVGTTLVTTTGTCTLSK